MSAVPRNQNGYTINLLVIGDSGTGKTSLIQRLTHDTCPKVYTETKDVNSNEMVVTIGGKGIKLNIFDTPGKSFSQLRFSSFYRNIHGIIIVYDVTKPVCLDSLASAKMWIEQVDRHAKKHVKKLLLGNKSDLMTENRVGPNAVSEYARGLNMLFEAVSAKNSDSVDDAFLSLINSIKDQFEFKDSIVPAFIRKYSKALFFGVAFAVLLLFMLFLSSQSQNAEVGVKKDQLRPVNGSEFFDFYIGLILIIAALFFGSILGFVLYQSYLRDPFGTACMILVSLTSVVLFIFACNYWGK